MPTRTRLLALPLIIGLAAGTTMPASADAPGADAVESPVAARTWGSSSGKYLSGSAIGYADSEESVAGEGGV